MRDITEVGKGDYVKLGTNHYEKISEVYGVSENGSVAKPSSGGFGVITESGRNVSMWQAKSYHKAQDIKE